MFGLLASLVNLQHLLAVLRSVEGCCLVFVIREPGTGVLNTMKLERPIS